MTRPFLAVTTLLFALLVAMAAPRAQIDPLHPLPGGASGENAVCIQVGDLNTGAFVAVYALADTKRWDEKAFEKQGAVVFDETQRAELAIELTDPARPLALRFDFVRKKVGQAPRAGGADWTDMYYILNATDRDGAADCLALAARLGAPPPPLPPPGAGGGRINITLIQNISIRPGTIINITPGTQLTATSGPVCPGQPGFFLCPNKFSCAPNGGVCCPGVGACSAGTFCDRFLPSACIGPGNPRFCPGSGDPATGISLHCAIGSVCLPGNICNP